MKHVLAALTAEKVFCALNVRLGLLLNGSGKLGKKVGLPCTQQNLTSLQWQACDVCRNTGVELDPAGGISACASKQAVHVMHAAGT